MRAVGKRRPRLGASDDEYDNDDDDDDDDYDDLFETEDERREIYSEAASEAIDMLRRNVVDGGGGGGGAEDEMDEEDMVNAVARALYERGGFRSARLDVREDDDDDDDGGRATATYSGGKGDSTAGTNDTPSYAGKRKSSHTHVRLECLGIYICPESRREGVILRRPMQND